MLSHYVATGYVCNKQVDLFLFLYHKKLQKWIPPGGHLQNGEKPHEAALREVYEETKLDGTIIELGKIPTINSDSAIQLPAPFCILYERIPAYQTEDEHMHINFIYVITIIDPMVIALRMQEVESALWAPIGQLSELNTYESVRLVCIEMNRMATAQVT